MSSSKTRGTWCVVRGAWVLALTLTLPLHAAKAVAPSRIVTLAPACAEVVDGLGMGEKLVGVSDYTDYPARTKELPSVGSFVSPSLEAVVALRPDLVVATSDGNPPAFLERLRKLGIHVHVLDLRTWSSIRDSIVALGGETLREAQARALVGEMDRVAACIEERTRGVARPRVLFAFDLDPAIAPGRNAFTNELVQLAGGESLTAGSGAPYPRLSLEQVIALEPEVIVVSSMGTPAAEKKWREWLGRWATIPAVRDRRVHVVDSTNLDRPSQRVVIGLRILAAVLHPKRFPPGACMPRAGSSAK